MASPQYYINRNDKVRGPFSEERVRELYAEGKLRDTDFLSSRSDGGWKPVETALTRSPASSRKKATSREHANTNSWQRWILISAVLGLATTAAYGLYSLTLSTPQAGGDIAKEDGDNSNEIVIRTPSTEGLRTVEQMTPGAQVLSSNASLPITAPQKTVTADAPTTRNSANEMLPRGGDATVTPSPATDTFSTFELAMQKAKDIPMHLARGETKQLESFQQTLSNSSSLSSDERQQLEKWSIWLSDYRDELIRRFPATRKLPVATSAGKSVRGNQIAAVESPDIILKASSEVRLEIDATVAALKEEIASYGNRVPAEKPFLALVVGQVALSDHVESNSEFVRSHIQGQCDILSEGFFVTAIGDIRKPLVFSAIGYTSAVIDLSGLAAANGAPKYIQKITLEKLKPDQTTRLRGRVAFVDNSSVLSSPVTVELSPAPERNTPGNNLHTIFRRGWDYKNQSFNDSRKVFCDSHGFYEIDGLSLDIYSIRWSGENIEAHYESDADLWRRGSAPLETRMSSAEAYHVQYVTSWQPDKQETQNLATNQHWVFYERPGVSRQGWGFHIQKARTDGLRMTSSNAPWFISKGRTESFDSLSQAADSIEVVPATGEIRLIEGAVYLAKNFNRKEWVLFTVQKGKISAPSIVIAPRADASDSNPARTIPPQQTSAKSPPTRKLTPAQIRETENWLREALKTQVPVKLDFPGQNALRDVTDFLADEFTRKHGMWKGKSYQMQIVMDVDTLKRMRATDFRQIAVGDVVTHGKTLAETLDIVLESCPGVQLSYEIREGQIVIIQGNGSR